MMQITFPELWRPVFEIADHYDEPDTAWLSYGDRGCAAAFRYKAAGAWSKGVIGPVPCYGRLHMGLRVAARQSPLSSEGNYCSGAERLPMWLGPLALPTSLPW